MIKLAKYLKTEKLKTIAIPIFIIVEVIAEVLIPVFIGRLIDQGIEAGRTDLIYRYGAIMAGLAVTALFFGIFASRLAASVSTAFARNLRQAQYENIQTFSFENIDKFSTSSLITRMTLDVSMVQNSFRMLIRIAFRAPGLLVFSIISSFVVAGKMGFIFVSVIPLLSFGFFIVMRGAHKHFRQMFNKIDHLNLVIQEDLSGIRTIKSYVREEHEIAKFDYAATEVAQNAIRAEKWIIFNNPILQFSAGLSFALIGWFGSYNMIYHGFTKGQFTNVITYVMQVLFSLMMISNVFLFFVISKAAVDRITEVLDEKTTLGEKEEAIEIVKDGSVEFRNACFKYQESESKMVLNNINLKIPSGAFVGVFGGTGTGKTSLVQLIPRLYDVNRGQVLVGGVDVRDYKINAVREAVMLVLQKNVLFSGTLRDNIKYGKADATDEEIIDVLKKAQAYSFVSKWEKGLDTWIEQGGVNVSGGQRQRLTIARALITDPKVLILDDSTSAVDTKTDALIREMLRNEKPEMTKIVVSQRIASIENADLIVILDDDGINAIGDHQKLYKTNQIYQSVYDAQKKGVNNQ